jgi:kynurenine 3-monooxygenase
LLTGPLNRLSIPLIPDLTQQFFKNPTGHMVTVKCQPWNDAGNILLMGDAAHAIVPFFGQGMNCGFEDVSILLELIGEISGDFNNETWENLFSKFSQIRKPNADAIADLAVENFVEMRDKVGDPKFLLAKEVEQILERSFPGEYISRYRLVSFSRVPYATTVQIGLIESQILGVLCDKLTQASDVDLVQAKTLIHKELAPLMEKVIQQHF